MADQTDLTTAIESCRPGSADLGEPEMERVRAAIASDPKLARQFEALHRFDARLGKVIRQGDVPPGLEERIEAALAASDETATDTEASDNRPIERPSRRRLWAVAAIAATVATVATGVTLWRVFLNEDRLARTVIEERAAEWCDALNPAKWKTTDPPQAYRFASEVQLSPDAWQRVSLPDDAGDAVAYRLTPPAGARSVRRMTLLVLEAAVNGVPNIPPQNPYKTQDRLVASWQVGGNVYVLVIQGEDLGALQDTYQRYVKTQFPKA
jgi:hypothetical protein